MLDLQTKWDVRLIKLYYTDCSKNIAQAFFEFLNDVGIQEKDENGDFIHSFPVLDRAPHIKTRKDVIGFIVSELPQLYAILQKSQRSDAFDIAMYLQEKNIKCRKNSSKSYFKSPLDEAKKAAIESRVAYDAWRAYREGLKAKSDWSTVK